MITDLEANLILIINGLTSEDRPPTRQEIKRVTDAQVDRALGSLENSGLVEIVEPTRGSNPIARRFKLADKVPHRPYDIRPRER